MGHMKSGFSTNVPLYPQPKTNKLPDIAFLTSPGQWNRWVSMLSHSYPPFTDEMKPIKGSHKATEGPNFVSYKYPGFRL